jgi:hypothetical protein
MTEKTFMAGFGGQGIISLGQLWVYSAIKEGLKVTFFPSMARKSAAASRAPPSLSPATKSRAQSLRAPTPSSS